MGVDQSSRRSLASFPIEGLASVVTPTDPLMGEWWADRSGFHLSRNECAWIKTVKHYGRRASFAIEDLGKWTFAPEGRGVRLRQYAGDAPDAAQTATVDVFSTWDGRPWADPYGPALIGQLVQHWRLGPRLVIRLVLDNVSPAERLEWSLLAASADGSTLAVTSWDDGAPDRQDLLMFVKQGANDTSSTPHQAAIGRAPLSTEDLQPKEWIAREKPDDPLALGQGDVWRVDPHLLACRETTADGSALWRVYAIAGDGMTLAVTRWDEAMPGDRRVEVFTKAPV